jgi:uncharacterized protein
MPSEQSSRLEEVMRKVFQLAAVALLYAVPSAYSQTVNVSGQNRTVEVSVTESVSADAEVAEVTIGCVKYGSTHDQAYQENLRVADQVIKALLAAGVPKENISSSTVELGESESDENSFASAKKLANKQFKAHQSWTIRAAASDAQRIIDLAVQAGANGIESVTWDVKKPEDLEARARTAALIKARQIAGEMAKTLDANLGEALYVSNGVMRQFMEYKSFQTKFANTDSSITTPKLEYSLQLFPARVEKSAEVHVVFALDRTNR